MSARVVFQMGENTPDSGYAYVIMLASFMGHFIMYGITYTLGLFYVEFRQTFIENKGAVALISSLNTTSMFLAGPVASFLTNRYGQRVVCFCGGLIAGCAFTCSAFAYSIYTLYCTFGILSGFGLGVSYVPVITILGGYFVKRRALALGFAVSGGGLGNLAMAPLLQYCISVYGWRGCCLLLAGFSLNLCVIGCLFRPITLQSEKTVGDTEGVYVCGESTKGHVGTSPALLQRKNKDSSTLSVYDSIISLHKIVTDHKDSTITNQLQPTEEKVDHINLFILKDLSFVLLCFNNFCIVFGGMLVFTHLPAFSLFCGYTSNQGAMMLAVTGLGGFTGRILAGVISHLPFLSEMCLYTTVFCICGLAVALTTAMCQFLWICVIGFLFGNLFGAMGPLLPQVVIRILDLPLLVSGYGVLLVFEAVGALLGPPVAEWLFDYTRSYDASFCLGGAMFFLSSLLMIYPWWRARAEPPK